MQFDFLTILNRGKVLNLKRYLGLCHYAMSKNSVFFGASCRSHLSSHRQDGQRQYTKRCHQSLDAICLFQGLVLQCFPGVVDASFGFDMMKVECVIYFTVILYIYIYIDIHISMYICIGLNDLALPFLYLRLLPLGCGLSRKCGFLSCSHREMQTMGKP